MMKKFNIKTPSNINIWWNFGSMISIFMIMQIFLGLMISMNYMINNNPFISSFYIYYNINFGWMMRIFHSNMTSMIFLLIMIHIKRNLIYSTFYNSNMWLSGMIMLIIFMLIAFLGYSLIWTQMSYWGMMVITNFISTIPYFGKIILNWIWGNFNINLILINRFFIMHFLMPMILLIIIFIHINILHLSKSTNPLGLNKNIDLITLNPYSLIKDLNMYIILILMFMNLNFYFPFLFNNFDNFNEMNYFNTPNHIEPEWYFLFFYSILRSIPNKLSGLMMMIITIMILFIYPYIYFSKIQNNSFNFKMLILNIFFMNLIILISIMGSKLIEYPYNLINLNLIKMIFFFFFFIYLNKLKNLFWK